MLRRVPLSVRGLCFSAVDSKVVDGFVSVHQKRCGIIYDCRLMQRKNHFLLFH